jgi:hypothetical protein
MDCVKPREDLGLRCLYRTRYKPSTSVMQATLLYEINSRGFCKAMTSFRTVTAENKWIVHDVSLSVHSDCLAGVSPPPPSNRTYRATVNKSHKFNNALCIVWISSVSYWNRILVSSSSSKKYSKSSLCEQQFNNCIIEVLSWSCLTRHLGVLILLWQL